MHPLFLASVMLADPAYRDVAPILDRRCQVCHHAGTAAPFELLTYDDVAVRAETIREAIREKRMPPWHADPNFGHFANDRRLRPWEQAILLRWIDAGMPRGEGPEQAPKRWENGWVIGKPDAILEMPIAQEIPATGTLDNRSYYTDVPWETDRWVTAIEIHPSAPSVVHHAQFYVDGFEHLIASYDPGIGPLVLPPDTAFRFPAGHKLFWFMHYTPNGKAETDRTQIGLKFWNSPHPPKNIRYTLNLVNKNINIAPGDPDALVEYSYVLRRSAKIIAVFPHMHFRGKDFRLEVKYPDGRQETPLVVPHYDFYWQTSYEFQEPLRAPRGTNFHFISHYDNSPGNPNNPDPTRRVRWGDQSRDEMQTLVLDCSDDGSEGPTADIDSYEDLSQAKETLPPPMPFVPARAELSVVISPEAFAVAGAIVITLAAAASAAILRTFRRRRVSSNP